MSANDLAAWIQQLRAPLDAGEFGGAQLWNLEPGLTLRDVEWEIRGLLRRIDRWQVLPEAERQVEHVDRLHAARVLRLLRDALREREG